MTFKGEVKIEGADEILRLLQSLPSEVVSKNGGPVKAGLRKGARLIQAQELANFRALVSKNEDNTGLLERSIVVSRGKPPFNGKGERYLVRIKKRTYPGTGKGTGVAAVTTTRVAFLFEYGTDNQPPRSFIVSAFKARAREAIDVSIKETRRAIDNVVKRLARQNKVRGAK